MRNVPRLRKWGDHDDRNAEAGSRKGIDVIIRRQYGGDGIRDLGGLGSHVVVESAAFIVGENENRILPVRTLHQRIDQARYVFSAFLNVGIGMFVQLAGAPAVRLLHAGFDKRNLRQGAALQIGEVLGNREYMGRFIFTVKSAEVAEIGISRRGVDLPGNTRVLQKREDGVRFERGGLGNVIHDAQRRSRKASQTIGRGAGEDRREEAVRGRKLRSHEVVVREFALGVV